jgi:hypothetical protein
MKRQYLGDSKDSFKWDYHQYLAHEVGCKELQIVWMMTADDGGPDGRTPPERFPAHPEIIKFCKRLCKTREPGMLAELPDTTGARYKVRLYKPGEYFSNFESAAYFSELQVAPDTLLFLDPDNGFEPEKSCSKKHVRYTEVAKLLKQTPSGGVISVFQHFRRKAFDEDFARIRERLNGSCSTAIFWHSLMFVCISSSAKRIGDVLRANRKYAQSRPVNVLG